MTIKAVVNHPEDCIRIQNVLLDMGYNASLSDCEGLWREYSSSVWANWLYLPESDTELQSILIAFLED